MVRFYLAFGYLLCKETGENFDGKLHMGELASCLSQLRELYTLRQTVTAGAAATAAAATDAAAAAAAAAAPAAPPSVAEKGIAENGGAFAAREFLEECEFSAFALLTYQGLGSTHEAARITTGAGSNGSNGSNGSKGACSVPAGLETRGV
jgi:hypothetical protein